MMLEHSTISGVSGAFLISWKIGSTNAECWSLDMSLVFSTSVFRCLLR